MRINELLHHLTCSVRPAPVLACQLPALQMLEAERKSIRTTIELQVR